MAKVRYKEYSEQEDKIYEEAIAKARENIKNGMGLEDAFQGIEIEDEELRGYIMDDALKIAIAEMYFGQGMSIEDLSHRLNVSVTKLHTAIREMLEDIGHSSVELLKMTYGEGGFGNA